MEVKSILDDKSKIKFTNFTFIRFYLAAKISKKMKVDFAATDPW
jgi:hypothetical protein